MSFQIDTAFVKQYHDVIERMLNQRGSKLGGTVRNVSQESEEQFWEQIDNIEATEVLDRHGDSPLMETPHFRRRCTLRTWEVGELIDKFDKVKMLIDPQSTYIQNFVDALGRKKDDTIITAVLGDSYTGKAGTTALSFSADGGTTIAANFGGAAANLTINKLIEAQRVLRANHFDFDTEPVSCVLGSSQLASLLKTTQVQSADYNTVRALVKGEIDTFMGFKFVHSERLKKTGNDRSVLVYPKSAVILATGMEVQTEVARRADKRFSLYAYAAAMYGGVRMQGKKVVEILCDETV
jgi:hypothetical protein